MWEIRIRLEKYLSGYNKPEKVHFGDSYKPEKVHFWNKYIFGTDISLEQIFYENCYIFGADILWSRYKPEKAFLEQIQNLPRQVLS